MPNLSARKIFVKYVTLTYMYIYLFLFQPLVFGDECSNSSPKSRLSLYKDIPSLEQDISSFEASLQAEVKMLESSKELLKVKQWYLYMYMY